MTSELEQLLRAPAWFGVIPMVFVSRPPLAAKEVSAESVAPRWSVARRAERAGVTREAFSRAFVRRHGMPPHAFGLVARLNLARALLRSGAPIAAAAAEAGFADQSHLGRCFRRTFGVTPGRYRAG
jgi:AraC-like DNA-binding protein